MDKIIKIEKDKCSKFQTCSAALCPLDINKNHYWYSDTEVCSKHSLDWIKTQKKIQKINKDPHSYYTVKMLKSIQRIAKDITGLDYIGYSETKEREWIQNRENRHE